MFEWEDKTCPAFTLSLSSQHHLLITSLSTNFTFPRDKENRRWLKHQGGRGEYFIKIFIICEFDKISNYPPALRWLDFRDKRKFKLRKSYEGEGRSDSKSRHIKFPEQENYKYLIVYIYIIRSQWTPWLPADQENINYLTECGCGRSWSGETDFNHSTERGECFYSSLPYKLQAVLHTQETSS